jgi:hypothetical protein
VGGFRSSESKHDRNRYLYANSKDFDFDEDIAGINANISRSVLGSSPGEDDFCISEAKHDRRMTPGSNLLVSVRKLEEQDSQRRIIVLCSTPDKNNPFYSETKHDRRMTPKAKWFRRENYRKKGYIAENCPGFESK